MKLQLVKFICFIGVLLLLSIDNSWGQCPDQVEINPPIPAWSYNLAYPQVYAQSFTATKSGRISSFTFKAGKVPFPGNPQFGTIDFQIIIREGNGSTGPILYTSPAQEGTWPDNGAFIDNTVTIPAKDSPDLTVDQMYTIQFNSINGEGMSFVGDNGYYSGGQFWVGNSASDKDVDFTIRMYTDVPTVPIISGDSDFCEETITLTASADAGNSFQWLSGGIAITGETSNTLTVSEGGTYTVLVTDGSSCSSISEDFVVNERPVFAESVAAKDTFTWQPNGVTYLYSEVVEFYDDLDMVCDTLRELNLTINKTPLNDDCGNILNFDGANDYVRANPVNFVNDELTIEYFFKGSNPQSAVRLQSGGGYIVSSWQNGRHILSWDGGESGLSRGTSITDGEWHHVALTWKRNTINGFVSYLDGVIVDQRNSVDVAIPDFSSIDLILGSDNGINQFTNGALDEVRIWNRSLTQSELRQVIDNGTEGSESDLLVYYDFDTGFGNTLLDRVADNHGTLVNMEETDWTTEDGDEGGNDGSLTVIDTQCSYLWPVSGIEYFESGDYVQVTENDGCTILDSLFLTLTPEIVTEVVMAEDSFYWSVTDETYLISLQVDSLFSYSDACDTLKTLELTINKTPENGTCGNVLNFDGVDEYVSAGPLTFTNDELTIEYYFKGTNSQSAVRIQSGGIYMMTAFQNNKHILSWDGGENGLDQGASLTDGIWHHAAITWKRNTANGFVSYLDGNIVDQRTSSNTAIPDFSNINLFLGSDKGTSQFTQGALDEVRIWNRALTQTELREVIGNGVGETAQDLLLYYNFNAGSEDIVTDQIGTNEGTLINMDDSNWTLQDGSEGGNRVETFTVNADDFYIWPITGDSLFYSGDYELVTTTAEGCRLVQALELTVNKTPLNDECGNVLFFDGRNDYVRANPISFTEDAFTIEYYVKGSNTQSAVNIQSGALFIKSLTGTGNHLISWDGPNEGISGGGSVDDGNWHHVAMTWQKNAEDGFVSYLDGVMVSQSIAADVAIPDFSSIELFLGSSNGSGEFLEGAVDEVRIWNKALTQEELRDLIENGTDGAEEGLLVYYDFNEGIGTRLIDQSSSANHGTLFNFSTTNRTKEDGTASGNNGATQVVTSESSFNWEANGETYFFSGFYETTLMNAAGCDSTVVLDLTINHTPLNDLCGASLFFDGIDDFVKTPAPVFTADELTIEFYYKGEDYSPLAISDLLLVDDGYEFAWDNSYLFQGNDYYDGNWHHLAVTWKRNSINGFVSYSDGIVVDQANSSDAPIPDFTGMDLLIGALEVTNPGIYNFGEGAFDEVKVWNKALTQEELQDHILNGVSADADGLLMYFTFSEGTGASASDEVTGNPGGILVNMEDSNWRAPNGESPAIVITELIDTLYLGTDSILFNNQYLSAAGTYSTNLVDLNGCDSIVNLTIKSKIPSGIVQLGGTLVGDADGDFFGYDVQLSAEGTVAAVGAPAVNALSGQVQIYKWINNAWVQRGDAIDGQQVGEILGLSIDLSGDGNVLVTGSSSFTNADGTSSVGKLRIYQWNGTTWQEIYALEGTVENGRLGSRVSINSDGSVVAYNDQANTGDRQGVVTVLEREAGTNNYTQLGNSIIGNPGDRLGQDRLEIDQSGTRLVTLGSTGVFRTYDYHNDTWSELQVTEESPEYVDLSTDGTRMIIGYRQFDSDLRINQYFIKVFEYTSGSWTSVGQQIEVEDFYGSVSNIRLALNGDGSMMTISYSGTDDDGVLEDLLLVSYKEVGGEWLPFGQGFNLGPTSSGGFIPLELSDDGGTLITGLYEIGTGGLKQGIARVFDIGNNAPVVLNVIDDQLLDPGFTNLDFDLTNAFEDPDVGQELRYTLSSSHDEVVTVSVSGDNLFITEVGKGLSEISITANDRNGGTATITFQVSVGNVWDGTGWTAGSPPSATEDAAISQNFTVSTDGTFEAANLEVMSGAMVTIDEENAIVVNNDLTMDGDILLNSGGVLAIFGNATGSGELTANRNVTRDLGYSIVGTTVGDISMTSLGIAPDFFFGFDGTQFTVPSTLETGKGYFVAYDAPNPTWTINGRPTTGAIDVTLDYTDNGDPTDDFNLFSNPYNAAIGRSSLVDENEFAIDGTTYYWQDGGTNLGDGTRAGTYITVSADGAVVGGSFDGNIRSGQGFFVRALSSTTFRFDPSHQVTDHTSNTDAGFFRKEVPEQLRLSVHDGTSADELLINFTNSATVAIDQGWDAHKFMNPSLSIYTLVEETPLAIQALPGVGETTSIPLGYRTRSLGKIKLTTDLSQLGEGVNVYLIDLLTETRFDLRNASTIELTLTAETSDSRFVLEFNPNVLSTEEGLLSNVMVYGTSKELKIKTGITGSHDVFIYSMDGKLVHQEKLRFISGQVILHPDLNPSTLYILQLGEESVKFVTQD